MASVVPRERADGGVTWQVRWVVGGGRRQAGVPYAAESFTAEHKAIWFKGLVDEAGQQWPAGWVKGEGFVEETAAEEQAGLTFDEVRADWIERQQRRVKLGRLDAYTVHRYERTAILHLSALLGGMRFVDMRPRDIEDWVEDEVDGGASPKSIRNWHGVLHSICKHGVRQLDLRADNPAAGTELPRVSYREVRSLRFFEGAEWEQFRNGLKEDVHLLVDTMLDTGMRWGEISALRVGDLMLNPSGTVTMKIVRAWTRRAPDETQPIREDEWETKKWKLSTPKNKKGRFSTVAGEHAELLWASVDGRGPEEYVFATRSGCAWRYEDFHYDRWRLAREAMVEAGVTKIFTPHMLRHTTVVWALAEGVSLEKISDMIGHASIQITYDIYGGLLDPTDPELGRAMARLRESKRVITR